MKKIISVGSLVFLVPAMAACTHADFVPEGAFSPHAGEAVERNIAAQLVNPTAPSGDEVATMNGERAALAQDRYAKDQVKQPPQAMSGGIGGGNGTGGGGSGFGGAGTGAGASATP